MFVKNKSSLDFSDNVRLTYHMLPEISRMTDIWRLLSIAYGNYSFELVDQRLYQNGEFESYLLDKQIDWMNGRDVDFEEIKDSLYQVGDFTGTEKIMFSSGDIEERLWAIFLAICSPGRNDI